MNIILIRKLLFYSTSPYHPILYCFSGQEIWIFYFWFTAVQLLVDGKTETTTSGWRGSWDGPRINIVLWAKTPNFAKLNVVERFVIGRRPQPKKGRKGKNQWWRLSVDLMKFDFIQFGQWSPNLNSKQSEIDGGIKLAYLTWTAIHSDLMILNVYRGGVVNKLLIFVYFPFPRKTARPNE